MNGLTLRELLAPRKELGQMVAAGLDAETGAAAVDDLDEFRLSGRLVGADARRNGCRLCGHHRSAAAGEAADLAPAIPVVRLEAHIRPPLTVPAIRLHHAALLSVRPQDFRKCRAH